VLRLLALSSLLFAAASASARSASEWTGFYAGAHAGAAFAHASGSGEKLDPNGIGTHGTNTATLDWAGFLGGAQIGYDAMTPGRWVFGGVVEASGSTLKKSYTGTSSDGTSYKTATTPILGALRGRVGYAPGSVLYYATAGLASSRAHLKNVQGPCAGDPTCSSSPVPLGTTNAGSTFTFGWTAGAGAELRIGSHWTTGLEYLFEDHAKAKIEMPSFNRTDKFQFLLHVARLTASYRF
jgi:high affinity Mn2+ porin